MSTVGPISPLDRLCPVTLGMSLALAACGPRAVPWVPAGPPTHVTVQPPRADARYDLVARDASGGQSQCTLPCALSVPSGTAHFSVTGTTGYNYSFAHVLTPQPTQVQLRERNQLRGITGSLLGAVGSVSIGASFLTRDTRGEFTATGGILSLSGCILAITGLVMVLTAGQDGFSESPAAAP